MIKYADISLYKQAYELFDMIFDEDKVFNEYFFKNIFNINNLLVYMHNNRIIAMTQTIPYRINGIGELTYIYGAATHPKYRNNGLMSELLNKSFELDKQKGFAGSILIPANESLFDFYAKFGYKKAFYKNTVTYKAVSDKIMPVSVDSFSKLNDIYEKASANVAHTHRTKEYWQQQIRMFQELGGFVFCSEDTYAFGWINENDKPEIQELIGDHKEILAGAVAYHFKTEEIKADTIGNETAMGVIKLYNNEQPQKMYMNLMYN